MNRNLILACVGVFVAIAITTTLDATGYTMLSALPLFPLIVIFWACQQFGRGEIGFAGGKLSHYGLALLYPVTVLGIIAIIAIVAGAVDTSNADWREVALNAILGSLIGTVMVLITEEGFFRGWLWASLKKAGQSDLLILVWTSLAFTLWHVSVVTLDTGFDLPVSEIPIFLINVTLLGLVWGMFRMISGSVIVPSVSHAVWNAIDYPLFGFGEKVGALGIEQTEIFGPEVGFLGVLLNLGFAAGLWVAIKRRSRSNPVVK